MKLDLIIEKNVVIKRDKPWQTFHHLTGHDLVCYNDQKKYEVVDSSNGKLEHLSNKTVSTFGKSSIAHTISNNGQLLGFLSSNYEVLIWDKNKTIRTIPACLTAIKAIKTQPSLYISNTGDQVIVILKQPFRMFLWLKSIQTRTITSIKTPHKSPICSSIGNRVTDEIGSWEEISLHDQEQLRILNDDQNRFLIDVFFRPKQPSATCALVYFDSAGFVQLNRVDIDWKSTIYAEQPISSSLEIFRIPLSISGQLNSIHFAHSSPILAISISTQIIFISLTTIHFSRTMPVNCSVINTTNSPTHRSPVLIQDFIWSFDDQFVIGITNRGALFFVNRLGCQINLMTTGECIAQGPTSFVIIHPLIGQDSEPTTHLGLESFMRSVVTFAKDDKTKQQQFSITMEMGKPVLYCSDGYRLARLAYSDQIRDRRLYDPLLYLHVLDVNQHQQSERSVFLHGAKSFEDLPKLAERFDTGSLGGGVAPSNLGRLSKYGSLTSLAAMEQQTGDITLDELFSAYQLLFTSSDRLAHDHCLSLERTTRSLLLSSNRPDLLTSAQLSHHLTNLLLSSSFGSLTFLHLTCLTKFVPLFIDIFQKQTTMGNDPDLFHLCVLYLMEQWLQAVLYLPTKPTTFELCRRQKTVYTSISEDDASISVLCKGVRQLELLQGTKVNLDEFLASAMPHRSQSGQEIQPYYHRLTLLRSWYKIWSSIEKRYHRERKTPPKYLLTIRLFLQSLLSSYPSLSAVRLSPYGYEIDLNDLFPPMISGVDHPLHTKGYTTLNERRKQRRRSRNSIDQTSSARLSHRKKPVTESRKASALHRLLYALLEQYQIRDAVCILNVALRRETSLLSSCLPLDLFSANLFQHIDTRTHFGLPGHALKLALRTLARFMARAMITEDQGQEEQPLFIYSVDSADPLPNLFRMKDAETAPVRPRMIYLDRKRLNLAVEQQKMSKFWQPLKVLELFILAQSPNEAVLFAKLVSDWRTAVSLASVLPSNRIKMNSSEAIPPSPLSTVTPEALLYGKLCEYLQINNLKALLKRSYKQDEIVHFIKNLSTTLEQFLLYATLQNIPLAELLFQRLNAIIIYLFILLPTFIPSKYYLPCPPIYSSILNTYDDEKNDISCKYETHLRLILYRTIHIFTELLTASRIQLSCFKWYFDYLTMSTGRRKTSPDESPDSFHSIRLLLKSLRFHKLPNIPNRVLIYFRDFCILLFMLDVRDRLSLTLRQYLREKLNASNQSDRLAWKAISYGTILLSFRCLLSDEMALLRTILNLFFDLPPSEKLMEALARLVVIRQQGDDDPRSNAELTSIIDQLQAKWARVNPTFLRIYDGFLQTIAVQDVQADIVRKYTTERENPHDVPLLDLNPKWFETWSEYGEFMSILVPNLLDTSSLSNLQQQESADQLSKFDSKSIPLLQTMSAQLRELELPISLDKRYILKQPPVFVPPQEYVVFPVRVTQYNNPHTMFQQAPTSINHNSIGSYVQSHSNQQPPDVVSLEHTHQRTHPTTRISPTRTTPSTTESEWDGRSDDPSRLHIRQFDPPYDETARQAVWNAKWDNQGFSTTTNDRIQTNGMRIPTSAQLLAASSLISDPQRYQSAIRQNSQTNHDQLENDTDLTSITKDSDDEYGNGTQSDLPSSPRRRETSVRKNSLDESVSLPIMSNDGGDYSRSHDFRAPSRDTIRDESPSYPISQFPTEYYKGPNRNVSPQRPTGTPLNQMSPPTSNGFQQQLPLLQPSTLRSSLGSQRYFDDSDPNHIERLAKEDREKYTMLGTNRTATSITTANGFHSPTHDSHRYRTVSPDESARQSPSRRSKSHRSSRREGRHHRSRHSSKRDQAQPYEQHYFSQLQPPQSFANYTRVQGPMEYTSPFRLPLLRIGGPSFVSAPNMFVQPRLVAPPISAGPTPAIVPIYIPIPPRPPLPSLHLPPQLPPPASLSPRATRTDQQKYALVQNIMQQYTGQNRPRLQLLQLRSHPQTRPAAELNIPMPVQNVVTTSTETKVDKDIQAEVPRQDGFVIEPGLFQHLLHQATGVNFTSAEAHYSAARQIQQQALDARKRERSTMTDQPAHQILYDLQYARGGEGDERKFVNVTDIDGSHVDALLTQIHRDQTEREQARLRQQQQLQPSIPPPVPMINSIDDLPAPTTGIGLSRQNDFVARQGQYPLGFDRHNVEVLHQPSSARLGFNEQESQVTQEQQQRPLWSNLRDDEETKRRNEIISDLQRQRDEEEKKAEQIAFGHVNGTSGDLSGRRVSYEPHVTTHEFDEDDVPLEYLIRQPRTKEPPSNNNAHQSNPPSARSVRSTATTATPRSPRKKPIQEPPPISIKTTTPRDPFSPRRTQSLSSRSTAGTPRKTTSPTIADRHREARQRQQQALARQREENALRLVDATLHGEHVPPSRALEEFNMEALESSFTTTVRELAGPDGFINRTYDLDLLDETDPLNGLYSDRIPSRPMSAATTSNLNRSGTQYSVSSSTRPRPSSASSGRSSRQMTPMGRAIMEVKKKGPPPARSNMARKRPMSSPGNLGQKRGSMTAPARTNQNRTRMVPNVRKASPPSHKATTYNERVRALNKTDGEVQKASKTNPADPKALMRLYGTRRVPGLYTPYGKTDPGVPKTSSGRTKDLQQSGTSQAQRRRPSSGTEDQDLDARPSSAPSSSISLSDWEVDDRIKHLLYDDPDLTTQKGATTLTPLPNLDELADDEDLNPTTYSLTRVTEQTNENTYGDDLRLLQYRRPSAFYANTYGGTRASARSSAGGDMTARDESEISRGENSIDSMIDWSLIDREYAIGTQ